jgi:hypothetical protein
MKFEGFQPANSRQREVKISHSFSTLIITFICIVFFSVITILYLERALQLHAKTKTKHYNLQATKHFNLQANTPYLRDITIFIDSLNKIAVKRIKFIGSDFFKKNVISKGNQIPKIRSYSNSTSHDDDDFKDRYFLGTENSGPDRSNNSRKHAMWSAKGGEPAEICYQYTQQGRCALVPCPGQSSARPHYRGFVREMYNSQLSTEVLANRTRGACELCTIYSRQCLVSHAHRSF